MNCPSAQIPKRLERRAKAAMAATEVQHSIELSVLKWKKNMFLTFMASVCFSAVIQRKMSKETNIGFSNWDREIKLQQCFLYLNFVTSYLQILAVPSNRGSGHAIFHET